MRCFFNRVVPCLSEAEEISFIHRNLLPRIQVAVRRSEVVTHNRLEEFAIAAEKPYRVAKCYRSPPTPDKSLIPDLAYREPKGLSNERKREKVHAIQEIYESDSDLDHSLCVSR